MKCLKCGFVNEVGGDEVHRTDKLSILNSMLFKQDYKAYTPCVRIVVTCKKKDSPDEYFTGATGIPGLTGDRDVVF